MKILGGNQVIFYASKAGNYEVQLNDCLEQLEEYMDENQIYPGSFIRHNIFVEVTDKMLFEKSKARLETVAKRRFPLPMLVNIIPQKPAEGQVALESTHIQSTKWNCMFKEVKGGSCQHMVNGKTEAVLGSVKFNKLKDFQGSVEKAFETMEILLAKCNLGFDSLLKQWSYIEQMYENELNVQRYQIFNDVRTKYYLNDFENIGFPASTEIGVSDGGILIEFFAVKGAPEISTSIKNPIQKSPHEYSSKVLAERGTFDQNNPTTPKVERAKYLKLKDKSMMFVSATAAIVGERVTSAGDVKEQTVVVLENFKRILANENLTENGISDAGEGKYTLVKAYVRNASDFKAVHSVLDPFFKKVPMVMVQADLPRKEMLVELEAEIVF